jgi:glycosyltransferase involved in cell wall biosynthesis
MKICFFAAADSANTRPWVRYFKERLGHDVRLITLHSCERDLPGIPIERILTRRWLGKLSYFLALRPLRRYLKREKPDLLVCFRMTSYGVIGALSGFRPYVLAAQNEHGDCPQNDRLLLVLVRYAVKRCALINSWAAHMTAAMVDGCGADPDKILTLPRGIDTALFEPAPGETRDAFTLIATRALSCYYYNMDLLIRALARILPRIPEARLVLAGEGPDRDSMEELARDLGVADRVEFAGMVYGEDLVKLLQEADLYVSPVRGDGLSTSLLEAMSCGLLPITVDHPSNRGWIREGENGFLFPFGDLDVFEEKILKAYENKDFRQKAGAANARLIRERGSLEKNMKAFEAAYLKLLIKPVRDNIAGS